MTIDLSQTEVSEEVPCPGLPECAIQGSDHYHQVIVHIDPKLYPA